MIKENLNILVIGGDNVDRMNLRRALKKTGFPLKVREVLDVEPGLKALQSRHFDCAYLACLPPDEEGLALLREFRAADPSTPIVILTAEEESPQTQKAMEAGADDWLFKSDIDGEKLTRSLHRALRQHRIESRLQRAEAELHKSSRRIIEILDNISDAFFALDTEGRLRYMNREAETLLRLDRKKLLGQNLREQLGDMPPWFGDALAKALEKQIQVTAEGLYAPLELWVAVNAYPGQDGISVYFRDISKRKEAEERLSFLANFDSLTALPNRVLLMDRLDQSLSRAAWSNRGVAVMFCDLDRFKIINDTLGHNTGDQLLKEVGERLSTCIRTGDTVARLGGDEFVILLNDLASAQDIGKIAEKVIKTLSSPVLLGEHEVFVTASIGISISSTDGQDSDALLKHADVAMYRAKELGKNNYQFYSPAMNAKASERLRMESALRRAIERNEFLVHYQPKVDLKSGRIVGTEALVRWHRPETGLVSPGEFLPLAEESDLIVSIDKWVMLTACAQNAAWRKMGYPPVRIAVNVSDRLCRDGDFIETVSRTLCQTGLAPSGLELELTEKIAMQSVENSAETLHELKAMGVHLSIDDFGTGYSSLSHLKRCPIDTLKIDRSFIRDITTDPNDAIIVEAIIAMGQKLNLDIVAEGVETESQRVFILERGCDQMQGYLFSKPVPCEQFESLFRRQMALPPARTFSPVSYAYPEAPA